ncbi:STM4014 family protein [Cryptosporangium sp. NPDC048952]|uniref:STM4014 family protein n=1 Tax=Cryptosporangium sp. NPDC048952 TaxID=3363961 RepID=UPI00371E9E0A
MMIVVVGNPENRRATMFGAAARAVGHDVEVLPWRAVAAGPVTVPAGALVRIDSSGEDAEVDRLLRGADRPAVFGEIHGGAAWYRGFRAALGRIEAAADAAGATLLHDIGEIAVLFDKRVAHARLRAAGVPVPDALPATSRDVRAAPGGSIGGYDELRAAMRAAGHARVFAKPAHGSSASGVIALQVGRGRLSATTSVELADDGRLYNSLRVRRYTDERSVATIVDALAPDGLHVERWFPKASIGGRSFDLRVLVVAGRPGHVVVRTSRTPLTNLHLGNARGDVGAVRALVGPAAYESALATCVAAAAVFPGSPHVGVDLMIGVDKRTHAVAEVNAFGDLLPGVLDEHGRSTYEAQVAALGVPV